MYKKVITTTTEETFESDMPPLANPRPMMPPLMAPMPPMPPMWGNTMPNTSNISSKMTGTLSSICAPVSPENTTAGVKLRLDLRELFHKYNTLLRAYILSQMNSTGDTADTLDRFNTVANSFATITNMYWPGLNTTAIQTAFTDLSSAVVDLINIQLQGGDTTVQQNIVKTRVESFARALHTVNALLWDTDLMVELWDSYTNQLLTQVSTRKNKLWKQDLDALDASYAELELGSPNSLSLADFIADGIFQWAPWQFQ